MNQNTEDVYKERKYKKKEENLKKHIITRTLIVLSILILNALGFINSVYATNINTANIYAVGDCGSLLTYKGIVVKVTYVEYINNR